MHKIVICIPTYKRQEMLKKLVLSIIGCDLDKSLIAELNIIIIDNDALMSAESVVKQLKENCKSGPQISYFSYPIKGLSNVRNELFKQALKLNPDFILGIDDDQYVSSEWINQLIITITANNGDIAMGPVIPVFEDIVSPYISYWFKYPRLSDFTQIKFFWTNNYIICVRFLLKHKLEFDNRFNSSGGEDTYFGVNALKRGAKINWAGNAIAYETVPSKRTNLKWLIKRCYNGAANFTFILKLEKNYFGLLKKSIVSLLYLLIGAVSLLIVPLPVRWRYWGVFKISESIGGFGGLLSFQLHEYAKER
jgi:succinoglycan biosynthesis protein ExoM